MRISDWSSDVCSSDLLENAVLLAPERAQLVLRPAPLDLDDDLFVLALVRPAVRGDIAFEHVDRRGHVVAFEIALVQHQSASFGQACQAAARASTRQSASDRIFLWKVMRSEEHTSELQSLMRISYAVFCLKKKTTHSENNT